MQHARHLDREDGIEEDEGFAGLAGVSPGDFIQVQNWSGLLVEGLARPISLLIHSRCTKSKKADPKVCFFNWLREEDLNL